MTQRPLIAALVVTAMALGAGAWWAKRSEPAPQPTVQRRDVTAAAWTRPDVEPALPARRVELETPAPETPSETPRAEVAKTQPEWVGEILRLTLEQWQEQIEPLSIEQRAQLEQKIYNYFNAEAAPELERRRRDKEWEFIGPPGADGENSYSDTAEDRLLIYSIVMIPKEGVYKIVLPREKFPDLYTLKERADALFSW